MSDMPDWLAELAPMDEDEEASEAAPASPAPAPQSSPAPAPPSEDVEPDPMDDLRGQFEELEDDTEEDMDAGEGFILQVGGLAPWQLFFLSVLLFLDVAIVGLMFMFMLGRMVLPV